jgi:hypothetical protein
MSAAGSSSSSTGSGGGKTHSKVPDGKILPRVGVIYTESAEASAESRSLAHYVGGLLASTGYADVRLVGMCPDGSPVAELPAPSKKISIVKPGERKPTELPVRTNHLLQLIFHGR